MRRLEVFGIYFCPVTFFKSFFFLHTPGHAGFYTSVWHAIRSCYVVGSLLSQYDSLFYRDNLSTAFNINPHVKAVVFLSRRVGLKL